MCNTNNLEISSRFTETILNTCILLLAAHLKNSDNVKVSNEVDVVELSFRRRLIGLQEKELLIKYLTGDKSEVIGFEVVSSAKKIIHFVIKKYIRI